jgi:Gpi18-like mannosyltransferase
VLFAPTVVVNSAAWGQCDSIYAAFCLGSLYFLLRNKPWWAATFFGVALSFKLQAIFLLPVLLIVLVVNRQRLLALLAAPAAFAVMLLPAILAGRDLSSLLMIYPNQVSTGGTATGGAGFAAGQGGGTGAGQFAQRGGGGASGLSAGGGRGFGRTGGSGNGLTQNAPTFYQWLGSSTGAVWKYVGLAASALVVAGVAVTSWLRKRPLSTPEIVVLATTVVLAVPFFLPEMHERYFYLADVLTIVMAFYVRRYWPVALLVSACSLLSYAPFLWNRTIVALPLVAFGEFLAVIATGLFFVAIVGRGSERWLRPRTALNNPIPPSPVRSAPSTVLNGGPSFVGSD